MAWYSITKYSEDTGFDRRTVKKRLSDLESRAGDLNAILYDSKQALPVLYQVDEDDNIDAQKEGAKLSRERRKKTRVERMVLEGGLVPAEEVVRFCGDMNVTIRDGVLAIPNTIKNKNPHIDLDIIDEVEAGINEALTNLAHGGIPRPLEDRMSIYLSKTEPATETDG